MTLGRPRLHLRRTDSTNLQARRLALSGAPHGTLVTAGEQSAGRGRQGRVWVAPPGRALLCSVVIRKPPRLLPLAAGAAVAETVAAFSEREARLKWPNDVLLDGRKVAGILVEGRPQERWAVVGVGINVAVRPEDLPAELVEQATGLGIEPQDVGTVLTVLLASLEKWIGSDEQRVLAAVRARDALNGGVVCWAGGCGQAAGIDGDGRLIVVTAAGRTTLDAGEVHLRPPR